MLCVHIDHCKVRYSSPSYVYFELLMACVTTYYVLCMLSLDNYVFVTQFAKTWNIPANQTVQYKAL